MYQVQNASPSVSDPIVSAVLNATDAETYEQSIEKIEIQFIAHIAMWKISREFLNIFSRETRDPSNEIIIFAELWTIAAEV